jgi:hypothetical protein
VGLWTKSWHSAFGSPTISGSLITGSVASFSTGVTRSHASQSEPHSRQESLRPESQDVLPRLWERSVRIPGIPFLEDSSPPVGKGSYVHGSTHNYAWAKPAAAALLALALGFALAFPFGWALAWLFAFAFAMILACASSCSL